MYCFSGGQLCSALFYYIIIWRCIIIAETFINQEIRAKEVRLISETGDQLGILPFAKALQIAEDKHLDLVQIAANANPPVCKLMNYDKHRYEQSKYEKEMRKKQKVINIKEVQLSVTIEENDLNVKVKRAIKFIGNGDKVKVVIRFRGRQIAHSDIGLELMNEFAKRLDDIAMVEKKPNIEGRQMIMILAPKSEK
ncbi:MAG: translation initiation factor IF-3 [Eubacteriales bacterium]|nr:translation initiation factor IF-3 [Eubacteriales bacterium]